MLSSLISLPPANLAGLHPKVGSNLHLCQCVLLEVKTHLAMMPALSRQILYERVNKNSVLAFLWPTLLKVVLRDKLVCKEEIH